MYHFHCGDRHVDLSKLSLICSLQSQPCNGFAVEDSPNLLENSILVQKILLEQGRMADLFRSFSTPANEKVSSWSANGSSSNLNEFWISKYGERSGSLPRRYCRESSRCYCKYVSRMLSRHPKKSAVPWANWGNLTDKTTVFFRESSWRCKMLFFLRNAKSSLEKICWWSSA